jgi:hypothetical protein
MFPKSDLKIAYVCRGGPENGPFSAMAARVLTESLAKEGLAPSAIYASSGSVPTALLGCTGEFGKLCDTWANLSSSNIVKINKFKTVLSMLRSESFFPNKGLPLRDLISRNWDLNKIFSPEAMSIKFPAVDICTNEHIIFSNRVPGHKKWFLEGVLGSMGLVPFLPPQRVFYPEEAGLIEKGKSRHNSLLLIDGGFVANMLLEVAMRDIFDVIFIIDIHGLQPTKTDFDATQSYHWSKMLRSAFHILSNTNDSRQYQLDDRINEEIRIKKELVKLTRKLPELYKREAQQIIDRMDNGRLRLGDKDETKLIVVSNPQRSVLFNFANFTRHKETVELLYAGQLAAEEVLPQIKTLRD